MDLVPRCPFPLDRVIVIPHQEYFPVDVISHHRITQMPEEILTLDTYRYRHGIILLRPASVVLNDGKLLCRLQCQRDPNRFATIVVLDVVPPVDEGTHYGDLVVYCVGSAHTHVIVRNRPSEEETAPVIPVVL